MVKLDKVLTQIEQVVANAYKITVKHPIHIFEPRPVVAHTCKFSDTNISEALCPGIKVLLLDRRETRVLYLAVSYEWEDDLVCKFEYLPKGRLSLKLVKKLDKLMYKYAIYCSDSDAE